MKQRKWFLFCIKYYLKSHMFKGIVSQDFEVCFLVPLDSSDIATPDGTGLFEKKGDFVSNFYFSGLGASSFRSERISAQRATGAHFVAPVRERQRNGVQIGLQRNNKYSFDREQPGLI
jgi:hypothetical protein